LRAENGASVPPPTASPVKKDAVVPTIYIAGALQSIRGLIRSFLNLR
jgi:hypothetical protein